jgi:hypothetical protein
MPVFYYLSDRNRATFAYIHYYDVCADNFVREDARRLVERPAAVLIVTEFPDMSIAFHDKVFRDGRGLARHHQLVGRHARRGVLHLRRRGTLPDPRLGPTGGVYG